MANPPTEETSPFDAADLKLPTTAAEMLAHLDAFDARYNEPHTELSGVIETLLETSREVRRLLTEVPGTYPSWKPWEPSRERLSAALFWLGYLHGCDLFLDPRAAPEITPQPDDGLDEVLHRAVMDHPPTADCPEPECLVCGIRDCPEGEPLHYHHDGCPICHGPHDQNDPKTQTP